MYITYTKPTTPIFCHMLYYSLSLPPGSKFCNTHFQKGKLLTCWDTPALCTYVPSTSTQPCVKDKFCAVCLTTPASSQRSSRLSKVTFCVSYIKVHWQILANNLFWQANLYSQWNRSCEIELWQMDKIPDEKLLLLQILNNSGWLDIVHTQT